MNFASLQFAWFFLAIFGVYWALPGRQTKNIFLLLISYYFYACWDVRFLLLIWFLTFSSHWVGLRIAGCVDEASRGLWLRIYIVLSLGVLAVFKYFNFFLQSMRDFLLLLGLEVPPSHLEIVLPAAISFFTFESLSYVIEIYQRHLPATTRLRDYALFIGFFPKLVAGPIERPRVLIPQIETDRKLTWENMGRGVFLVLFGLMKKVAIADGLAPVVDSVYSSPTVSSATDIALATLAFTFQIYCDFSGYSDIARGVSKMLGIELSNNFRFPYFSLDPSEFWRRWHISLSSWLRDYLYIPLGGGRLGEWGVRRNLMITMGLGGLWHGAAWNYVCWGIYQGLVLVIYRLRGGVAFTQALEALGGRFNFGGKFLRWMIFFLFTVYGWLLFRANSLAQIQAFTLELLSHSYGRPHLASAPLSTWAGLLLLIFHDACAYRSNSATFYTSWSISRIGLLCACFLFVILMGLANTRSAFIYFQF